MMIEDYIDREIEKFDKECSSLKMDWLIKILFEDEIDESLFEDKVNKDVQK